MCPSRWRLAATTEAAYYAPTTQGRHSPHAKLGVSWHGRTTKACNWQAIQPKLRRFAVAGRRVTTGRTGTSLPCCAPLGQPMPVAVAQNALQRPAASHAHCCGFPPFRRRPLSGTTAAMLANRRPAEAQEDQKKTLPAWKGLPARGCTARGQVDPTRPQSNAAAPRLRRIASDKLTFRKLSAAPRPAATRLHSSYKERERSNTCVGWVSTIWRRLSLQFVQSCLIFIAMKQPITLALAPNTLAALDRAASEIDRSRSWLADQLLRAGLASRETPASRAGVASRAAPAARGVSPAVTYTTVKYQ